MIGLLDYTVVLELQIVAEKMKNGKGKRIQLAPKSRKGVTFRKDSYFAMKRKWCFHVEKNPGYSVDFHPFPDGAQGNCPGKEKPTHACTEVSVDQPASGKYLLPCGVSWKKRRSQAGGRTSEVNDRSQGLGGYRP